MMHRWLNRDGMEVTKVNEGAGDTVGTGLIFTGFSTNAP